MRIPPLVLVVLAAGLIVAVTLSVLAAQPAEGDLIHSLSDESLLFPLALRSVDAELYASDPWVPLAERVFSPSYSWFMGRLLRGGADPLQVAWTLSIFLVLAFSFGNFLLAREASGSTLAGLLLVGALLLPGLRGYGLEAGNALPRGFLYSLTPWLLLGYLRVHSGALLRVGTLGLVLGVATNLHPLTGLHLALVLAAAISVASAPPLPAIRRAIVFGLAFLLGALPYALQFLAAPRQGPPVPEALTARVPGLQFLSWSQGLPLWGGVALLLAPSVLSRLAGIQPRRPVLAVVAATLFLGVTGSWIGLILPAASQLQLSRLGSLAGLLGILCASSLLAATVARPSRMRAVFAVIFIGVVVLVPTSRWALGRLGRRMAGYPPPPAPAAEDRKRGGELARRPVEERRAFLALCRWVRENTTKQDLFLIPPEDFSSFRLYARRGVAMDRKCGGFAVTFLGQRGMDWLDEYRETAALYARSDGEEMRRHARAKGATYVLGEWPWNDLALPVVHREDPFTLYRASAE